MTSAMGLMMLAIGMLSLFRTKQMNDLHIALINLGGNRQHAVLSLRTTRLIGVFFMFVGAIVVAGTYF